MLKKVGLVVCVATLFSLLSCSTTGTVRNCPSPYDYVKKVYSSGDGFIEYKLAPDFEYKNISVIFFGKRNMVMRNNTVLSLKEPQGKFKISDEVFIPPAQRWFNFTITDNDGCRRWALVNELPLQGETNKISIDEPSGEGAAFVLKQ